MKVFGRSGARRAAAIVAAGLLAGPQGASAGKILWADWTGATLGENGEATGHLGCEQGGVAIVYTGEVTFAQTDGGTIYWDPAETYLSDGVSNAPLSPDIIGITGGLGVTNTITFSQPVTDPVLAVVSLGRPNTATEYEFDTAVTLLSSGCGHFGCGSLEVIGQDVLRGQEGNGVVRFAGTFTSISWTVPLGEYWHGITIGVPTGGPCVADCDGDGGLDLFDFLCFVNRFNTGDEYADCDGNCTHDLFDFLCYTNAFNGGC